MTIWFLLLPIFLAAVLMLATTPFHDVTRERLERFAARQCLRITPDNGPIVIRYLATTRRWRGGGLLVTIGAGVTESIVAHGELRIGAVTLFIGWFVGAVIAEWRVSVVSTHGHRRTASLLPRRARDYVAVRVRWAVGVSVVVLLVGQVVALVAMPSYRVAVLLGAGVVAVGIIGAVARHVLLRAQPPAEHDVLVADESIRSRSLHVLAGSALAITGYLGATTITTVLTDDASRVLSLVPGLGLPLLGILVARSTSMLPARATSSSAQELSPR
ncbi:MAG: hypothetical protein ABI345_05170 [Jatrophihabitans sp.]